MSAIETAVTPESSPLIIFVDDRNARYADSITSTVLIIDFQEALATKSVELLPSQHPHENSQIARRSVCPST